MVHSSGWVSEFIGRQGELKQISALLSDPACRLLTLVGPGGIGKTRLAIEAARQLASPDMTFVVMLQPLPSPDFLVSAIADALGFQFYSGGDSKQQLLNYLREKVWLLVLDNFEHLVDGATLLSEILDNAPGVRLLVTSRERLNLQEEWVLELDGLDYPADENISGAEDYGAIELFVQHAHRVKIGFKLTDQTRSAIVRVCRLVDGMPLGIELAAGWVRALSFEAIADEIERSLDILETSARNVEPRHRTMRAAFEPTWAQLSDHEREVLKKLSVFRGGFTREAAEVGAGASLSTLSGLVDKSLLRVDVNGRYDIHELIRQYAEEHLDAAPDAKKDAHDQHCAYYAGFLHRCQSTLRGQEQAKALDEIEHELDNIRVSWEWAVEHGMMPEIHQSMHSLYLFCHIRVKSLEGERLFELAFNRFEHDDSATLAYILLARVVMGEFNGKYVETDQYLRAVRMAYDFWTEDEIAIPLGIGFDDRRYEPVCRDFLERFRTHARPWGVSYMLYCQGAFFRQNGQLHEAELCHRQSLDGFLQIGDRWASAWPIMGLAWVFEASEQYREAQQLWQMHEDICVAVGDRGAAVIVPAERARIAWKQKDFDAARFYIAQGIKAHFESGTNIGQLNGVIHGLIEMLVSENRHESAAELSSFLWQQADNARAPRLVDEAHQVLESLAPKLSPDVYQRAIARGKNLHLKTILDQLFDELTGYAPPAQGKPQLDALTERELEVLRLIAKGYSNQEIADRLVIGVSTVKKHINHINDKLAVKNRTQAVAVARERGTLH
jgi:predicted ATPase/DNA-binding CsgD family transcriptional regulator